MSFRTKGSFLDVKKNARAGGKSVVTSHWTRGKSTLACVYWYKHVDWPKPAYKTDCCEGCHTKRCARGTSIRETQYYKFVVCCKVNMICTKQKGE